MVIEKAAIEDAKEILELQKLAYRSEAEIYGDFTIPPLTQTLDEIQEDFRKQLFLKAVKDGRIVGSVRAFLHEGTCCIGRLIVHPDQQSRGLGTRLMGEIEALFGGAKRYELFTGHRSERNIHLYRKLGYGMFKRERVNSGLTHVFLEKRR
jgi:ribosomal protein S18 acetylase RimI-like enzyme